MHYLIDLRARGYDTTASACTGRSFQLHTDCHGPGGQCLRVTEHSSLVQFFGNTISLIALSLLKGESVPAQLKPLRV